MTRRPAPQTVVCPDTPMPNTEDSKSTPVFHVDGLSDQRDIADRINRNIAMLVRSRASRKGWESRKRMLAKRAEILARENEG